jgi:prepilin-type N-terminal cleavage/methylation domain-containing protein
MSALSQRRGGRKGFTLVEMLVAVGVFTLIMSLFLVTTQGVQRIWTQSERKVESMQNGRAVLELFSRELAGALVSDRHQFVQSPNLSPLVNKTPQVAPNSPSLFWIAPVDSTSRASSGAAPSNPCEIGYYLTRDDATGTFRLNRLVIPPESPFYEAGKVEVPWDSAPWLTATDSSVFDPASPNSGVSPLAEGVVAMWIRCFDLAGHPIPWLGSAPGLSAAAPLQFNSAAPFQMTDRSAPFPGGATFQYLASSTAPAHRLPGSVEITLVLIDARTLARKPAIPAMPAPTTVEDVPAQIRQFQDDLNAAGLPAETLSVRVPLANSTP